jgi:hypothetical protein
MNTPPLIRDPGTMTSDERRREVASILATGLLRHLRWAKPAQFNISQISPQEPRIGLAFPSETRLSVSQ